MPNVEHAQPTHEKQKIVMIYIYQQIDQLPCFLEHITLNLRSLGPFVEITDS